MEYNTLGSTIRKSLLKYAIMESISIWDYNGWSALWMTFFSSYRISVTILVAACITVGSLGFIILRKKEFTQKDTLCAFIFMVVSIFLLESVQKMLKIEVLLDGTYSDVGITVPFSPLIINNVRNREIVCRNTFNDKLETTADKMQMGERAAEAYRKLVKETMLKKRSNQNNSINSLNSPNNSQNTTEPARISRDTYPMIKEYCIYKKNTQTQNTKTCPGCIYLQEKEFEEAKADLQYIDRINREYEEIERDIAQSKDIYRTQSVELMKNFKNFNKLSYFVRDEMSAVGISLNRIERAILRLVNKYEMIFAQGPKKRTKLTEKGDSLCIRVGPTEPADKHTYQIRQKRTKKKIKITEETQTHSIGRGIVIRTGLIQGPEHSTHNITDSMTDNSTHNMTVEEAVHDMIKSKAEAPILNSIQPEENRERETKTDPFFHTVKYFLTATEVLIFIQVLLVLGLIISIVFDKKWMYFVFYGCMCGSLLFSLFLGYSSFVHSSVLSSLCKSGLKCEGRTGSEIEQAKTVGSMIDIPEAVLKHSIERSEEYLQKRINTVITSNVSEEIEGIGGQIDRLFQIRKDFDTLTSTNIHRNLVRKEEIFETAGRIKKTLHEIKRLDRKIRGTKWTESFKALSQINILLSKTTGQSNRKKREILSNLSNHKTRADVNSCTGKEEAVCEMKERFDSLFVGLFLFSVVIAVVIAV